MFTLVQKAQLQNHSLTCDIFLLNNNRYQQRPDLWRIECLYLIINYNITSEVNKCHY